MNGKNLLRTALGTARRKRYRKQVNPPRIIVLGFASAILIGTVLLKLPIASARQESLSFVDALFTATSATCVTGLIVRDTGSDFSRFGQMVILVLIQMGGLGIMTMSTAFLLLLGKRLSFREQMVVKDTVVRGRIASLKTLIGYIVLITFTFEFIGTLILHVHFRNTYGLAPYTAFYQAAFHSVSAFCNAGFSLYTTSLSAFRKDWITLITMGSLIVLGGLGFIVIYNVLNYRFWLRSRARRGKLLLQTKTVLITSAILVVVMLIAFLTLEWNHTLLALPVPYKVMNGFFHAVTPRTAGFNTIPVQDMSNAVLFITLFMMFIGASPGSTGGGIKTCTLAVLIATSRAIVSGREEVRLMRRSLSRKVVQEAICVALFAIGVVILICMLLLVTEKNLVVYTSEKGHLLKLLFETVSAFGTVGLSTGITPSLTTLGRLLITITMFVGRIGPLTLALIIAHREKRSLFHYPEEDVMIG